MKNCKMLIALGKTFKKFQQFRNLQRERKLNKIKQKNKKKI